MSRVSYFQRFSQKENHATNNTLLILRYFYQSSPFKLQQVLTSLIGEELFIGLNFEQQVRGSSSVPDALITQKPIDIFIETKRGNELDENQIEMHIQSISDRKNKSDQVLLIGLTKAPVANEVLLRLNALARKKGITFASITFSQILEELNKSCAEYERDLRNIIEDYEEYLSEDNLLDERNHMMAVFPCGQSFHENEKFDLYYEPASRPCKRNNRFIGIYTKKEVALIGEVKAIAICSYQNGRIDDKPEFGKMTKEQANRVKSVIEATDYYDLKSGAHRFYLVDSFAHTNLVKDSRGGIQGLTYLDLSEIIKDGFESRKEYSAEQIAIMLKNKKFN